MLTRTCHKLGTMNWLHKHLLKPITSNNDKGRLELMDYRVSCCQLLYVLSRVGL
jgi:hypothetical protein